MNPKTRPNFETLIAEVKARPASPLKSGNVKRLLASAGKRPSDIQVRQVEQLIETSAGNQPLIFELLCELEFAQSPNPRLAPLKPALVRIAYSWFTVAPPPNQQAEETLNWLRSEAASIASGTPPKYDRFRATVAWLVAQYRSPDFFLRCLVATGQALQAARPKSATRNNRPREVPSGFVFHRVMRTLVSFGRGRKPRPDKLPGLALTVDAVLSHLKEKSAAADSALRKSGELEAKLAEERRLREQDQAALTSLEAAKSALGQEKASLSAEVGAWKQRHQQTVEHTQSQVKDSRKTLLVRLQSRIGPKLADAKLYLNRPQPAADQALRLLTEIEHALQAEEDHQ